MLRPADTDWLVARAHELGFDLCGVAPIRDFDEEEHDGEPSRLSAWLARGYAGEMRYLHNPRRAHPQNISPEARTVIVCAINYNTDQANSTQAAALEAAANGSPHGWISRYAWGDDYHQTLGARLDGLVDALRGRFGGDFEVRTEVDTGPIVERVAARLAGLGWLGKNTCLINERIGSWLFLATVVTSLEFPPSSEEPRTPPADLCGNCRLCLDACPTGALVEPYVMDARRCISYLTIELRGSIPEDLRQPMGWNVFGCDICQDVCPWNRTAPAAPAPEFEPREKLLAPELLWLLSLEEDEFRAVFHKSAVRRAKWRGLVRNACVAAGNAGTRPGSAEHTHLAARLSKLASSADTLVAEHARWALARIRSK